MHFLCPTGRFLRIYHVFGFSEDIDNRAVTVDRLNNTNATDSSFSERFKPFSLLFRWQCTQSEPSEDSNCLRKLDAKPFLTERINFCTSTRKNCLLTV